MDELQAASVNFRCPQNASQFALGQRIAVDKLNLTVKVGPGNLELPQTVSMICNHSTWPAGCLTKAEVDALLIGLTTVLQPVLPGIVYNAEPSVHQAVQQRFPEVCFYTCDINTAPQPNLLCVKCFPLHVG